MGEQLKISAYAISLAGQGQNLDNVYVNGKYLTAGSEDSHSVINRVTPADFQVYGVLDASVLGGTSQDIHPTAFTMQKLQRLQGAMAEDGRIDKDQIWDLLVECNQNMKEYKEASGAAEATASFAGLFLHGNRGLAVHMGDSRVYVIRGGRMLQITEDHLQSTDLYKYGIITQKQAEVHKRDSGLTACIGMEDIYDAEDMVFSKYFVFYPDDIFILVTDGVTDFITNEELERMARNLKDATAEEFAGTLMQKASEVSPDDKSIVVLRIEDAPGNSAPQRGTSSIPQRENFSREPEIDQTQPQIPKTDTTKLSTITGEVDAEDDEFDDEDYEGGSLMDKILGNPKRLIIVCAAVVAAIILLALILGGGKKNKNKSDSEASSESSIIESSESEENILVPEESEESSESSEISESSESSEESSSEPEEESSEESSEESEDEATMHTIAQGDTMYAILLNRYGEFTQELLDAVCQYNGISDPEGLSVGEEIELPTKAELGLE